MLHIIHYYKDKLHLTRYPELVHIYLTTLGIRLWKTWLQQMCPLSFLLRMTEGKGLRIFELLLVDPDTYCCRLTKSGILNKNCENIVCLVTSLHDLIH